MARERLVVVDGARFYVEIADAGDGDGPQTIDDRDAGPFSFDGVRDTVRAIGSELTQAWEAVKPAEASVEFGLKLTAKTGKLTGLLVEGGGEATLTVKMTWRPSSGS